MKGFLKMKGDYFSTCIRTVDPETGRSNLIVAPIANNLVIDKGIYVANDKTGILGLHKGILTNVTWDYDNMYRNFTSYLTWNKPTMTKADIFHISKRITQTLLLGMNAPEDQVRNMEINIIPGNIPSFITATTNACIFQLIYQIITKGRVEYSEEADRIFTDVLVRANSVIDSGVRNNVVNEALKSIFKMVEDFINKFVAPFYNLEILYVNDNPVSLNVASSKDTIKEIKTTLLGLLPDDCTKQNLIDLSGYITSILVETGLYQKLINSLVASGYPARPIRNLFGTQDLDELLYGWVNECPKYLRRRMTKLQKRCQEKNVSMETALQVNSRIVNKMNKFIDDCNNQLNKVERTKYSINYKECLAFRVSADNRAGFQNLQRLQQVLVKELQPVAPLLDIKKDSNDILLSSGTELYASLISKVKIEQRPNSQGAMCLGVVYQRPFIQPDNVGISWTTA